MKEKDNILLTEKPGNLMKKYSVPCIISLLVAALYNIVDQLFIANASYLGSYGNAVVLGMIALLIVELIPKQLIGIFGAANESVYYTDFAVKSFRIYLCMMVLAFVIAFYFITKTLKSLKNENLDCIASLT